MKTVFRHSYQYDLDHHMPTSIAPTLPSNPRAGYSLNEELAQQLMPTKRVARQEEKFDTVRDVTDLFLIDDINADDLDVSLVSDFE